MGTFKGGGFALAEAEQRRSMKAAYLTSDAELR